MFFNCCEIANDFCLYRKGNSSWIVFDKILKFICNYLSLSSNKNLVVNRISCSVSRDVQNQLKCRLELSFILATDSEMGAFS